MRDDRGPPYGPNPAELILAIAAERDRDAFVALFNFYAPRIKTLLMRAGAPAEVAEDVAQETLLVVWRKAGMYRPERAAPSTWIFTIARNLRIDRLRRDRRSKMHLLYETVEPEGPMRPDHSVESIQDEERLRAALDDLPGEQLRVLRLSFFEGLPHGDISDLLGIPLGTVKSRLRLAMSRLRNLLGDLT